MATPVNGIYVLQGVVPSEIETAPVGVKVVEVYNDDGDLFSTSQVAQMEAGGGEVLGYFSIGEAENFRSYFSSLPSSVLGPQDPSWPGDYQVAYWTPTWLTVSENYIQTMINQGYNGAFFDVVDEAEESWAISNVPGGTLAAAEGAMVTLIQELASYARSKDPNFQIWINSSGAEDMLANSALVSTINGAYEEQLFYQSATKPQTPANVNYNVALLDNVTKAGKQVVAIEYVSSATAVASVETQAAADGFGYYIANPDEQLDGVDTQGFGTGSTSGSGSGSESGSPPTVAITNAGGTTTSATQTITGTVDVADAGTTVSVLDGTQSIGSATVASNGSWSAKVTLAHAGANVLTATDTNAAGTGTSNAVTYDLVTAAPTVAITSTGGTTSQASQTVVGTVDVADAGTTVTVLDGTQSIGSATVASNGSWSAKVTLARAGANVLTATDTNAAGTGTSNAVTYDLVTAAPTTPTLSIANSSLTVAGRGGTVPLGISVTAPTSSTATTVTITGLPSYESIKDSLDGKRFSGSSVTLSEAEVNSGLTLKSKYRGSGHPVATLTITATDDIGGVLTTSKPQTITVTDPPPMGSSTNQAFALLTQYLAGGFGNQTGHGHVATDLSVTGGHDEPSLAHPRH
jgi:cysteinyl-tRNA synthetase, unknown class